MYAELNACMRKLLGAKCADFGCMYAETVGCKVCGNGWVQSMRMLGAKYMETFGCKVYAFWVHL